MDTQILWTKNENGTLDRVLGINSNTILTTNKNLSQLSDVNTTGVSAQKTLIYNATTQKWDAVLPTFAGLGDVAINTETLSSTNSIKYSTALGKWTNRNLGYALITISGRLKDSVLNVANTNLNCLNPANYETGTFTISSYTNNLITVDTTTNFQVLGLVNGGNYRIEWNFNYAVSQSVGVNGAELTFNVLNQFTLVAGSNIASFNSSQLNISNSLTAANDGSTAYSFQVRKGTDGTVVGITPLNVNMTMSVIEM
jgi:hypothetical protein